jgi:excisionase family DNA binding protein
MASGGITMLTAREIELARDVARELRAQGAEEKAAAIEHAVATATAPPSGMRKAEPRALFTIGQAARALGVSVQAIGSWVSSGQLQTVRQGDRVMISRDALFSFLDQLHRHRPALDERPVTPEEGAARRAFVLGGLPRQMLERAQGLTEKIEASQPLTPAEEDELQRLQDELARASWQRLKQWIEQQGAET